MFIIPLGMMRGANVSISDFLVKNLLPVTLGNIVGGALCVMGIYGSAFGKWFQKKDWSSIVVMTENSAITTLNNCARIILSDDSSYTLPGLLSHTMLYSDL